MTKQKTYATVELRRVGNGWIVYPGGNYRANSDMMICSSEVHVFESWERCEEFLFAITEDAA